MLDKGQLVNIHTGRLDHHVSCKLNKSVISQCLHTFNLNVVQSLYYVVRRMLKMVNHLHFALLSFKIMSLSTNTKWCWHTVWRTKQDVYTRNVKWRLLNRSTKVVTLLPVFQEVSVKCHGSHIWIGNQIRAISSRNFPGVRCSVKYWAGGNWASDTA